MPHDTQSTATQPQEQEDNKPVWVFVDHATDKSVTPRVRVEKSEHGYLFTVLPDPKPIFRHNKKAKMFHISRHKDYIIKSKGRIQIPRNPKDYIKPGISQLYNA